MPHTLTPAAATLKNATAVPGAWVLLATLIDADGIVRFRIINDANAAPLLTGGRTYQPGAFALSPMSESLKGDLPRTHLSVYDPRVTAGTLIPVSNSCEGFAGGTVTLELVYRPITGNVTRPGITHYFTVITAELTDKGLTFELGITSPLNRRFPRDRYVANVCRHTFRGGLCRFGELRTGNTYWLAGVEYAKDADITVADVILVDNSGLPTTLSYLQVTGPLLQLAGFHEGALVEISGTSHNDGMRYVDSVTANSVSSWLWFAADSTVTSETITGGAVRIRTLCDHTLVGCRSLANSSRYGGSPGMAEGNYG